MTLTPMLHTPRFGRERAGNVLHIYSMLQLTSLSSCWFPSKEYSKLETDLVSLAYSVYKDRPVVLKVAIQKRIDCAFLILLFFKLKSRKNCSTSIYAILRSRVEPGPELVRRAQEFS